ncbi:hypothetical protein HGRIS_003414 [Hohenbuehelia grisea]|uniref:Uncharacterized protein n=1 Tax=Hohenbuehelia grisea TaxID=104357 RepID=A0ABR3JGW2_9AGAR
MNNFQQNAVAGPSTTRLPSPPRTHFPTMSPSTSNAPQELVPPVFLPPPGPPRPPIPVLCTDDLLSRLHLLSAYDTFVRPFTASHDSAADPVPPTPTVGFDKGKAKERDVPLTPMAAPTPAADQQDGDDDEGGGGKGDKKKKNNYKHLIKGVPGKHSLKKDTWLTTIMAKPPTPRVPIVPLDPRTAREAFNVSLEGLKGWNPSALIVESAQAREDRKKRKELKRAAKAQQLASQNGTPAIPPSTPTVAQSFVGAGMPLSMPTPSTSGAPTSSVVHTPKLSGTPRPGSAVPRPGSARPPAAQLGQLRSATPVGVASQGSVLPPGGIGSGGQARGIKREREDPALVNGATGLRNGLVNGTGTAGYGTNGVHTASGGLNGAAPGNTNANLSKVGVKAGLPGVRPRPVKKQRMVSDALR